MDKRAMADQAVVEFGKLLTVDGLKLGDEDDSCVLVFDGDLLLNIEYDDASERLVFSIYLEELPRDNAEPLLRELMGANLYWHRTKGATLCLEDSTGGLMLTYASSVLELDNGRFENIVENMLDQAETWRQHIVDHREKGPQGETAPVSAMPQGAMPMIFG
jgi:hypothetical protein